MNRNRNDNPARGPRRDDSDANLKVVTIHAAGLSQSVLRADVAGMPLEWIDYKEAARLYHQEQVAYTCGSPLFKLYGGVSARTGFRTVLEVNSIVATVGHTGNPGNPGEGGPGGAGGLKG